MGGVELAMVIGHRWPAVPVLLVSGQGSPESDYPGAFLAKAFVDRMPIHFHTAILDAVVLLGGGVLVFRALFK